ncbi:MAG: hypothetical protein V1779_09505 [bacterium]
MFTDYFDYSFFPVESVLVLLIILYIHLRINKVLGKERKILPFVNKTFKLMNYVVAFFVLFFIVIAFIDIIYYSQTIFVIFGPFLLWLTYYIFYKKINGFNYNDKGIVIPTIWETFWGFEPIKWENIKKVEIDKDISQSLYGFYIHTKSIKMPIRCWIERKNLDEIKNLFSKYNVDIVSL